MSRDDIASQQGIILNACCLLHLSVSDHLGDIMQVFPSVHIAEALLYEPEFRPLSEKHTRLQPLIQAGVITVVSLSNEEIRGMADFARVFGRDCEASAAFLALQCHWAVGVDKPHSASLFRRLAPQVPLLSTPSMIKRWAEYGSPIRNDVARTIRAVESTGYQLSPPHPLYRWWEDHRDV